MTLMLAHIYFFILRSSGRDHVVDLLGFWGAIALLALIYMIVRYWLEYIPIQKEKGKDEKIRKLESELRYANFKMNADTKMINQFERMFKALSEDDKNKVNKAYDKISKTDDSNDIFKEII